MNYRTKVIAKSAAESMVFGDFERCLKFVGNFAGNSVSWNEDRHISVEFLGQAAMQHCMWTDGESCFIVHMLQLSSVPAARSRYVEFLIE